MNSVEKLIEEGRQQGLQRGRREGRREGRHEGQRQALEKLLRLKFGELGPEDLERIESADEATLDLYISRVLTADSVAAVLGR